MFNRFAKYYLILTFILLIIMTNLVSAQQSTIILKNGKRVTGDIKEDKDNIIILMNDLGEIKIQRQYIKEIHYKGFFTPISDSLSAGNIVLNDQVVIHLNNGEVVDGYLIAKSTTMVMLRSELGRLTLPKKDIQLIEYVSREFAERGEPVEVYLVNGAQLKGYLYNEDRNSITLTTKMGRLTVEKNQLQSVKYHTDVDFARPGKKEESYLAIGVPQPFDVKPLDKRMDSFEFNYSSDFGENYGRGSSLIYRNRYLLKKFKTFNILGEGSLGITGFALNKDAIAKEEIPGSVAASGSAIVTTLSAGTPIHLLPMEGSAYEFFITPTLETHIVHKSLTKTYPSFPSLNSENKSTDLRFGFGSQVGLEWKFGSKWRAGISFNMHYILGDSDYNSIAIHLGTRLY